MDFKDKKVLIFGLGLNDGGLGMAEFFLKRGSVVTITDSKTEEELRTTLEKLSKYTNVTYHLGGHIESDFYENDIIIRNPAIKPDNRYLKIAQEAGKEIHMEMSLFLKLCPAKTIGITGTKGKSTTTSLIYEVLRAKYGSNVFLGGNIGKSAIRQLDEIKVDDIVVLELSSFQLDAMGRAKLSPDIGLITNIYNDHIDWHGSFEEYVRAKKNIFLNQQEKDYIILNIDIDTNINFLDSIKSNLVSYSLEIRDANYFIDGDFNVFEDGDKIFKLENPVLKGMHNYYNILATIAACRTYGVDVETIKNIVEGFKGVPGRQEFVRELGGIRYYNDTCATSVEAMEAMFKTFGNQYKGKIIMIAGGVDKGMDYNKLTPLLEEYLKAIVLFEGSASEKIAQYMDSFGGVYKFYGDMKGAVDIAKSIATDGDVVILCPGAASFNMFANEFDRGDKFVNYVNSL